MDKMKPFLSIVIPEKDRYKYLLPLVKLIDDFNLQDTEIVIEDNSDDNSPWLEFESNNQIKTPIVYNYVKGQIPVRHNHENGIRHSNGEFICVIGDDDAVMPNIEDCARWMKKNGIECLRQKYEITYKWPSYTDHRLGALKGATLSYNHSHAIVDTIDARQAAVKVMESGFASLGQCPCYYQGIVSHNVLEKLYNIGGFYIPGPSPDMANAISLSFVVEKFCVTDIPFVISGGSEYQGGRNNNIKTCVHPLKSIPFISEEDKKKWDKRLPYIWTPVTVWTESGLKGLEYVGRKDLESHVDFDKVLSNVFLLLNKKERKKNIKLAQNKERVNQLYRKTMLHRKLSILKWKLLNIFNVNNNAERETLSNINSISDAICILEKTEMYPFEKAVFK